ncbi:hypothetical protein JHK84_050825 [Glycine max]|nr:hypothetical protein JHK86_050788 [Glycine max]KAG5095237.1 hypothetical protein JHK84_050825 [Glycine max]
MKIHHLHHLLRTKDDHEEAPRDPDMTSGGVDPPRPLSHDSSGKGTIAKKRRCMVRLLPPRDSLTSSTPFPSSMSIPVRPPNVAPTPSPPPTKARPSSSHVNAHGPSLVPISTPSPSSVDARGPSPIPTSTPSPSLPVGNMPIDENAVNLAMKDLPLNNHPMSEELGRFVYVDEVFQQTHLRKDTGQFVDDRSRRTHTLLKNKDLGVGVGLQLQDQSVRDTFIVLETLLILTNAEMTVSSSILKDLPVALKMLLRLTA